MAKAGKFEVKVLGCGWPVWVRMSIDGQEIDANLESTDLPDLLHATKMAMYEANCTDHHRKGEKLPMS